MSRFAAGNLLLVLSMLCASTSQLLFKIWLQDDGGAALGFDELRRLALSPRWPWAAGGALLLVTGFAAWILCLARLPLSYAYPVACSSVLLVALYGVALLGETMTPRMWLGSLLILIGVGLLAPRA